MKMQTELMEYTGKYDEEKGICFRCLRVLPYEELMLRDYTIFNETKLVYLCEQCFEV